MALFQGSQSIVVSFFIGHEDIVIEKRLHVGRQFIGSVGYLDGRIIHECSRYEVPSGGVGALVLPVGMGQVGGESHGEPVLDLVVAVYGSRKALVGVVVACDDTVVVKIAHGDIEVATVVSAAEAQGVLLHSAALEHRAHPIGIGDTVPVHLETCLAQQFNILGGVHDLGLATQRLNGVLEIVGYLAVSLLSAFCGDEDDTVTGLGTVDGRRGGILEDFGGFDVVGIQIVDVGHSDAIHHIERVGGGVGGDSPDAETSTALAGGCTYGYELDTRSLALKGLLEGGDGTVLQVLGLDLGDGSGQGALLLDTVADYHGFLDHLGVLRKDDAQLGSRVHLCRDIADA